MLAMMLSSIITLSLIHIVAAIVVEAARQESGLSLLAEVQFITEQVSRDVREAKPVRYFLRENKLYRKFGDNRAEEIARDVIKMKLNTLMEQDHLVGAQFWFLLRSKTQAWPQEKYYFDGKYFPVIDHANYFSWPLLIAVRERN
ncbi:MAG: hypothetical protein A3F10_03920 [Coxiella sp. RIFCSPHIGHO2_12_FULL_42_15]|nr:MAG: hypothetical protein A3F10_03920 [Coxiella sp. RIFCSPHIGHO2_12_FULL_42_15]